MADASHAALPLAVSMQGRGRQTQFETVRHRDTGPQNSLPQPLTMAPTAWCAAILQWYDLC